MTGDEELARNLCRHRGWRVLGVVRARGIVEINACRGEASVTGRGHHDAAAWGSLFDLVLEASSSERRS